MGYSGAGGKLIHKKNQKQKISWHCPFKRGPLDTSTALYFYRAFKNTSQQTFTKWQISKKKFNIKITLFHLSSSYQ